MPIHGNHDTWPVNVQDFSTPNTNVPLNGFKQYWAKWLTPESLKKFGEYGFYSQDISGVEGMGANTRVIGINTQACNDLNFYLFKNRYDPGNQIAWLQTELEEVEKLGGNAILVYHIPPNDCLHEWGLRFRAINDRFQSVIRFSMMGHTHDQDFHITKSLKDSMNIGVGLVAPSLTTFTQKNPAFFEIELDAEYMIPLNVKTHYYDIKEAN